MDATTLKQHIDQAGINASTFEQAGEIRGGAVHYLAVPGSEAVDAWHKLRALTEQTGSWPVLIGRAGDEDLAHIRDRLANDYYQGKGEPTLEQVLQRAEQIDPAAWLEKHRLPDPKEEDEDADELALMYEEMGREVPETQPPHEFAIPRDISSREFFERAGIVLLPTTRGCEAPALWGFGGFNACPVPEEQTAVLRRWEELYGAEVVGITHDVLECYVNRPPTDDDAAKSLAREQYAFCDDIVDQGTMTIERLKDTVKNATAWFFWWD